ncbi:hypothetical protein AA0242T_2204 [Acetobacter aceti NRIC 0242]|uniref:DUF202 domain-containing protein n=1 Tax=Acetobacter aceti NBRC 14818 TaxID=887700 RepID=A0AB33IG94_ACEAC|nr:DUF202 domain-containing protein [Acetobacter aceti]TCS29671.1 putative membrane protein [Acetobacter aceti NBRC 14818]BCK77170.1 hypothetical protein EMQ_2776 [Acetobacter aceti NBRC 14818]GAN58617.1 hypothetical protein Abac_059_016 [Acetobacter aceti NBRC 14818]GBO81502.1 hypothetical protein AA0242T_2204 [Acetobacter aceti NRIC 0242]
MIERYTDHAANERTFLAWIRTALALVAFGCVLAKFDLFLRLLAVQHAMPAHQSFASTSQVGILTVLTGILLIPVSYWRFCKVRTALNETKTMSIALAKVEGILTIVLIALCLAVFAVLLPAVTG